MSSYTLSFHSAPGWFTGPPGGYKAFRLGPPLCHRRTLWLLGVVRSKQLVLFTFLY